MATLQQTIESQAFNMCSADDLFDEIRAGQIYSFARYGDGEWWSVLGRRGVNADSHEWTPQLQAELTAALLNHGGYRYSTLPRLHHAGELWEHISHWLCDHCIARTWYNSEVFADSVY